MFSIGLLGVMRKYPDDGSVDVLFVTYGGGHVQMVVPVAAELRRRNFRVAILALTTAIAVVELMEIDFFTFSDIPQSKSKKVQSFGAQLTSQLTNSGIIPHAETVAYLGLNYVDLEGQIGEEAAAETWKEFGRQKFHPKATMANVFADIAPRVVVATNSPRAERAAIEAATELEIPAVVMVDTFALQEVKWLSQPNFGKKLYVLNDAVRKMMIGSGRPSEDVIVTGNPAFDQIYDDSIIHAGLRIRKSRGYGRDGRVCLLYASQPEPERHPFTGECGDPELPQKIEYYLRKLVAEDSRLEMVVRRHPSENQFIELGERVYLSSQQDNISSLIHATDIVVVATSTVGIQAYLAGKPVISIEASVFSQDVPFAKYGMARGARDVSDLGSVISEAILHIEKFAENRPKTRPISATEKVANDIVRLLQS